MASDPLESHADLVLAVDEAPRELEAFNQRLARVSDGSEPAGDASARSTSFWTHL